MNNASEIATMRDATAMDAVRLDERNVRLLSRHWEWLDTQPRSASAGLRALVEDARRDKDGRYREARAKETCYLYMRDMAGDRPHFEEAVRALFSTDNAELHRQVASWPTGIRVHIASILGLTWSDDAMAGES